MICKVFYLKLFIMKISLEKEDILKELKDNHVDDLDFLFEIVEECTHSWESMQDITKKILMFLEQQDSLGNINFHIEED